MMGYILILSKIQKKTTSQNVKDIDMSWHEHSF
jgi:hypothetical protein